MKKITALDEKLMPLTDEDTTPNDMPTRRAVLRLIGNIKAETSDESRRTMRIINKLRDKTVLELILENEDMSALAKLFEKNAMNLTAWCQGQILEAIDDAEKVDPLKVV